jgi:hypothetical protein
MCGFPEAMLAALENARGLLWTPPLTLEQSLRRFRLDATREQRIIDRAMRAIDVESSKLRTEVVRARSRRSEVDVKIHENSLKLNQDAKLKLLESKGRLSALDVELRKSAVQGRLYKATQVGVDVMRILQSMAGTAQLRDTAREMSKAMFKQGLVDKVIDEALDAEETEEEETPTMPHRVAPQSKKVEKVSPEERLAEEYLRVLRNAPMTPDEEVEYNQLGEDEQQPAVAQMAK